MFRHSIEKGRVQNQAERQNKINVQNSNKKNLIQQKMAKDQQVAELRRQEINDKRTHFGPVGLTDDHEKAIVGKKRAQAKRDLEAQIIYNARYREANQQQQRREGEVMINNIEEALRQERLVEEMQQKSKQELLRTAWDSQIATNKQARDIEKGSNNTPLAWYD